MILMDILKNIINPNGELKETILGYERRQDDTSVNTNKIVQYSITMTNGAFTNGELMVIYYMGDDSGTLRMYDCQ